MDYLKGVSKNVNLYDVKAYVRKAQNGMLIWEVLPNGSNKCNQRGLVGNCGIMISIEFC